MSTPQRPGWYPAPDGSGTEQWWNGAAWSDARRGPGGSAMPGLPGYQAAPPSTPASAPVDIPRPDPYAPPAAAARVGGPGTATASVGSTSAVVALVLGIVSIFVFAPLGLVAIIVAISALGRPTTIGTQRTLAIVGIITGAVGLAWGAIQFLFFIVTLSGGLD